MQKTVKTANNKRIPQEKMGGVAFVLKACGAYSSWKSLKRNVLIKLQRNRAAGKITPFLAPN